MPGITIFIDLFFGVACLVVLGVVLFLAVLLVHLVMKASNAASTSKSPETLALKSLQVKAGVSLGIVALFAFLIWQFVFAPLPVLETFREVFHQAPPPSAGNIVVSNLDSWGDSTVIDMTFQISQPDLLKLIGTRGKAITRKEYLDYSQSLLREPPAKQDLYFSSTKLCDPQLATCTCTIGYDQATKTAYVDSNAND